MTCSAPENGDREPLSSPTPRVSVNGCLTSHLAEEENVAGLTVPANGAGSQDSPLIRLRKVVTSALFLPLGLVWKVGVRGMSCRLNAILFQGPFRLFKETNLEKKIPQIKHLVSC